MKAFDLPAVGIICAVFIFIDVAWGRKHAARHRDALAATNEISRDDAELWAMRHSERVTDAASCDVPKVHVVHVSDHYPGKYYLPHCTVLHRCGKHSGCCGTDRLRCVAAAKEKVGLYFYSVRIAGDGEAAESKIEKLVFANHTKCGCVPNEHMYKIDL